MHLSFDTFLLFPLPDGPGGATFVIDIAQKCTLGELKEHLYVRTGVKVDEQNLKFQGQGETTIELADDRYVCGGGWWASRDGLSST